VDGSGGAPEAVLPDDYAAARTAGDTGNYWYGNWLDSVATADGYLFFMYISGTDWRYRNGVLGTPQTRYVRMNLTGGTPTGSSLSLTGGQYTISSVGAYFSLQKAVMGRYFLYAVGGTADNRIVVLMSNDDGVTWHDYAVSDAFSRQIYAPNGPRFVTSDGFIIGEYTELPSPGETSGTVRFFKIPALDSTGSAPVPSGAISATLTISGTHNGMAFSKSGPFNLQRYSDGSVSGTLSVAGNSCYRGTVNGTIATDGQITLNYPTVCSGDSVVFTGTTANGVMRGTFTDSSYPGYVWSWSTDGGGGSASTPTPSPAPSGP
jgi:hypothetical protein